MIPPDSQSSSSPAPSPGNSPRSPRPPRRRGRRGGRGRRRPPGEGPPAPDDAAENDEPSEAAAPEEAGLERAEAGEVLEPQDTSESFFESDPEVEAADVGPDDSDQAGAPHLGADEPEVARYEASSEGSRETAQDSPAPGVHPSQRSDAQQGRPFDRRRGDRFGRRDRFRDPRTPRDEPRHSSAAGQPASPPPPPPAPKPKCVMEAIDEVHKVIGELQQILEELEEVMDALQNARVEKESDEAEIERLKQLVARMTQPRAQTREPRPPFRPQQSSSYRDSGGSQRSHSHSQSHAQSSHRGPSSRAASESETHHPRAHESSHRDDSSGDSMPHGGS